MKVLPTFAYEMELWKKGLGLVAGLDEVGRGAFAGPVVTAAVIFAPNYTFKNKILDQIDDSKRLSENKREELVKYIEAEALCLSISEVGLPIINEEGIGKATQASFRESAINLCHTFDFLLTDAFPIPGIEHSVQRAIIHGDRLSISIAAASIIAKVYRDQKMKELHSIYPQYGFNENKGYGTGYHRKQISQHGLSNIHRASFNLERYSKATA